MRRVPAMTNNVAIDNDFLSHLVEIKGRTELFEFIVRFFIAMGISPEMHPLVHAKEVTPNQSALALRLFSEKVISISDFDSIKNNPTKKTYYEMQVKQVYYDFMGTEYPCKDVCEDWQSRKSLGEVHKVVFCATVGYDCFLSDDKDAAKKLGEIILNRMSKPVEVKNRQDCHEYIKNHRQGQHNLNREDLRVIAHKHT